MEQNVDRGQALKEIMRITARPDGTFKYYYHPAYGLPHLADERRTLHATNRLNGILQVVDATKRFFIGGAHIGYTAFNLVARGGTAVCVERQKGCWEFSRLVAQYNGFKPDNPLLLNTTVEDFFINNKDQYFDYGILLMVFHHMWKTSEKGAFEALNMLAARAPKIVIQVRPKAWTPPKEELPDYILKHSILKSWVDISPKMPYLHGGGNPIYLFSA